MGGIFPTELANLIRKKFKIRDFVETGTYYGRTAKKMAELFQKVWTIELSRELYNRTKNDSKQYSNIEFFFGDSPFVLPSILKQVRKPSIFWLDAHWSGENTTKGTKECPVLDEISLIREDCVNHVIFIDDARLFLAPPPLPHKREDWPDIVQIIDTLRRYKPEPYIVCLDDVIIGAPKKLKNLIYEYWQNKIICERACDSIRTKHSRFSYWQVMVDFSKEIKKLLT